MAKKKTYYIPTIEIMMINSRLMEFPLEGSPSHAQGQAPQHRVVMDNGVKTF